MSRSLALRRLRQDFGGLRGLLLDELLGDIDDVTTLRCYWLLVRVEFSLLLDLHP